MAEEQQTNSKQLKMIEAIIEDPMENENLAETLRAEKKEDTKQNQRGFSLP